jgi:hypothetical protein
VAGFLPPRYSSEQVSSTQFKIANLDFIASQPSIDSVFGDFSYSWKKKSVFLEDQQTINNNNS